MRRGPACITSTGGTVMAIIKQYHAASNTTYVYESTSYWDPEKKQPRSKRRLIGKIDPVTGETVPTGKPGRRSKKDDPDVPAPADTSVEEKYKAQISEQQEQIRQLTERVLELQRQNDTLTAKITKASAALEKCAAILGDPQ